METRQLLPDYRVYCDRFIGENNEELNIKIPNVINYSSAGYLLSNLIKGIGILAQYSIENENDNTGTISIITDLVEIVKGLDFQSELEFVDKIISFSQQEELAKDEKTKVLEEQIKMLKGSNRYLNNELSLLKSNKSE